MAAQLSNRFLILSTWIVQLRVSSRSLSRSFPQAMLTLPLSSRRSASGDPQAAQARVSGAGPGCHGGDGLRPRGQCRARVGPHPFASVPPPWVHQIRYVGGLAAPMRNKSDGIFSRHNDLSEPLESLTQYRLERAQDSLDAACLLALRAGTYLVCVLKRRLNQSKLEELDAVPWATSAGQIVLRRRSPQVSLCTR